MEEVQLVEKIAEGDEAALEALYQRYHHRLVRFLWRVTNERELIVEIVNDTFFAVWKSASKFRGDSAVSTWILGIAYKKGLNQIRSNKRLLEDDLSATVFELDKEILEERSNSQLLQRLSPQHRTVMELIYHFGYSYKEIASIMDCSENTVKTRMFYGRKQLRKLMEGAENVGC